ncbi:hypothetical protein Leryth_016299 [Lithospermum erythrorhizon]|nr:hypothetical protein Leryth_016299 [Lithospermum erythrorhizon]
MSGATVKEASESSSTAELRRKLREKWELASVLNFLHVFEPAMEIKLKLSAEDIETALIELNDSLVQLHIALLKGITTSKLLDGSEAWITVLCRVAQGDFPLSAAKGKELSRYKELDPIDRLLILKAVCEARAAQDDIMSFINESVKGDIAISTFRKEKIADENGTAYWYDGDGIIGLRLYREVYQFKNKIKVSGKDVESDIYIQWETVATNLEEFRRVRDEYSTSELKSEVSVSKTLEVDVIPPLEKLEKKKQRALKQLEKQNAAPYVFQSSRLTRSSRNLKPINYTYDEFDRTIKEAIQVGTYNADDRNRKIVKKPRHGTQRTGSTEEVYEVLDSPNGISTESDSDIDGHLQGNHVYDSNDDEYENEKEDAKDEYKDEVSDFDERTDNLCTRGEKECSIHPPKGSHFSSRIAGTAGHGAPESMTINTKNRLRQRPSVNTAFDCSAPDSEGGNLSNNGSKYFVPDSEEENSSDSSSKRRRT